MGGRAKRRRCGEVVSRQRDLGPTQVPQLTQMRLMLAESLASATQLVVVTASLVRKRHAGLGGCRCLKPEGHRDWGASAACFPRRYWRSSSFHFFCPCAEPVSCREKPEAVGGGDLLEVIALVPKPGGMYRSLGFDQWWMLDCIKYA